VPKSNDRRKCRAGVSCGFDRNELVSYILHLYPRVADRGVFKVQFNCLHQVGAKFFSRRGFREASVTQRTRGVAASFRGPNLEDQLHDLRISSLAVQCNQAWEEDDQGFKITAPTEP
jgi:hypothetical protein